MSRRSKQIDAHILDATVTNASEATIAHNLGRTPVDAIVLANGGGSPVYRGTTAWDSSNIYLQAVDVDRSVRLLIF